MAADGPGPDYCKACKRTRGSDQRCDDCAEPAILPEAEPALDLYLSVQTQWRYGGMGVATGLDYGGVAAYAQLRGLTVDPDTLAGLQVCECAALQAMSERAQRESQHGRR